jgi:predicted MFS family arabinose efflux permease
VLQATSWQTWWIALGCSSALAALAVWRWVPADAVHAAAASAPADQGWRPRLQLTLRSPGPWLVSLGFMLYSGQWMGIVGFLPTMYAQAGLSAKLAGMLTAVVAAANIVGNVASGKLLYRGWNAKRCLQTGYLMMGLTVLLAYLQIGGEPLAPLWLRFAAVVLFSAAGGLIPATLFTSAMHLAPSQGTVSTTVGFMQQWSCVGQFAGPPLVAAVATHMGGWQFTWMVTGSMCVLGWLLALGVHRCWSRVER